MESIKSKKFSKLKENEILGKDKIFGGNALEFTSGITHQMWDYWTHDSYSTAGVTSTWLGLDSDDGTDSKRTLDWDGPESV